MIGYLRGNVAQMYADCCFLDVQGVGYRVYITESTRKKLSSGASALLYTYMQVREDAMLLYGFCTQEEYELFLHLISVNGIGPKVALGILSVVEPKQLCLAVSRKDMALLTKIPGIGKKTAERLVLELKDKIGTQQEQDDVVDPVDNVEGNATADMLGEAAQALVALGYAQSEFMPVLKKAGSGAQSVEAVIKLVLRELSRR
jgi:Holliday junction DNA helicase RuvA